jgi:hypothetical protein
MEVHEIVVFSEWLGHQTTDHLVLGVAGEEEVNADDHQE